MLLPQNIRRGTLQAYVMQKRRAAKKLIDMLSCISEGETYYQNYSSPTYLHYGPGVDSASNRNEYQEYFLGVKVDGE